MLARHRALARNTAPEWQPWPDAESARLKGEPDAQDQDTPSDYERELDRLDAAARADR